MNQLADKIQQQQYGAILKNFSVEALFFSSSAVVKGEKYAKPIKELQCSRQQV